MQRREFLHAGAAALASVAAAPALAAADPWGAEQGYPTGWSEGFNRGTTTRVGNYSGGYERMLPHRVIQAAAQPRAWREALVPDLRYRWGFFNKTPAEYMQSWPITGLLVARDGQILYERYGLGRQADMRLTSWSMAKSVSSLLLGICLDRGLIASYDDTADKYLDELAGTLHGQTTLRHLSNMSSGAAILHERDNMTIYPKAFLEPTSDLARVVSGWNQREQPQGMRYNYNELCPLTLGMVMRKVSGGPLSDLAQGALWQPLGAEGHATWTTDSRRNEFNCVGFAARLRDWARLGQLVADGGQVDGRTVVSRRWLTECTSWGELDQQVRHGRAGPGFGYKAHFWHARADGSRPFFNGHHGQRVVIDLPTRTVLAHTAVEHQGNWTAEMFALFDAACRL